LRYYYISKTYRCYKQLETYVRLAAPFFLQFVACQWVAQSVLCYFVIMVHVISILLRDESMVLSVLTKQKVLFFPY
jgi:hypothetical protein